MGVVTHIGIGGNIEAIQIKSLFPAVWAMVDNHLE